MLDRHQIECCDNLDKLLCVEMRPRGLKQNNVQRLYRLVRGDQDSPLTFEIATSVLARRPKSALIVTGIVIPESLPFGETDGPIGAAVLAKCLNKFGIKTTILVEIEIVPIMEALLRLMDVQGISVKAAQFEKAQDAEAFASAFDLLVSIEKLGQNPLGVRHTVGGHAVTTGDPFSDLYARGVKDSGGTVIAIGDNGNEIGFGNIRDAALDLVPYGAKCRCPCGGGIIAEGTCDYLLPAAVSNYGAYALVNALGVVSDNPELLLAPTLVQDLLTVAIARGCRNGGRSDADFHGDDGIPIHLVMAWATLCRGIAEQYFAPEPEHY